MDSKKLIQALGFTPKENSSGIFQKKYTLCENYTIEVDFDKKSFLFGDKIKAESKTTQNFSQAENWVVLECVDRLLEKGYQPQNITLEKTFPTGHGTSGRLDILISRNDGSAYMMIECKTWGAAFEKEFKNLEKNGGQLFTYFQQDKSSDILMLYASELEGNDIRYRNEIIKIEKDYRQTGNVKDLYERWNKLPKSNGIFDSWATAYEFVQEEKRIETLESIDRKNSISLFNNFMKILRKHSVSDKPNAFNKIFNLFICKIYDEWHNDNNGIADFVIKEDDTPESFITRITKLYESAVFKFLQKRVIGLISLDEYSLSEETKKILEKILVQESTEFAIIEIIDESDFLRNSKIVGEIVKLLQDFKIRYDRKNKYLSDFFELLLATGLKQESGQYFTPIPIVRFILKSLPMNNIINVQLLKGELPKIIDYASGSGHFLHESMDLMQDLIQRFEVKATLSNQAEENLFKWKSFKYSWADQSIYGIEKDYRLSKVAKVGCYMHGDGIANIINGDGLDDFYKSKEYVYVLNLKGNKRQKSKDNPVFDIVVSNPPFSVNDFKWSLKNSVNSFGENNHSFDLYDKITDQSKEIECLFIERTKQLLKDGGVAGIVLPSSILSNTGIYIHAREILLKYFDVLAIAEMGSNTFMATGTNTVTLFLRRRNNADAFNIEEAVKRFFTNLQDVTINGIENPIQKYIAHVWEGLSFEDYKTLLQKAPNEKVESAEIYQEYQKKLKAKNKQELWDAIFKLEQEKILYFILTCEQKIVLVKTGSKNEEKRFLGYEFSNRRGSEGIHPIQRSKSIDECTQLYDAEGFDNPEKASTYIYQAFNNRFDLEIPENLQKNVSYNNLVDMLTFDRVDFEKNISLSAKKKIRFESKWEQVRLDNLTALIKRGKSPSYGDSSVQIIKSGQARGYYEFDFSKRYYVSKNFILDDRKLEKGDLLLNSSGVGTAGRVTGFFLDGDFVVDSHISILRLDQAKILPRYALNVFGAIGFKNLESLALGQSGQIEISYETIAGFKIPLPPKNIQEKIVTEIEELERHKQKAVEKIEKFRENISATINNSKGSLIKLDDITTKIGSGATPKGGKGAYQESGITFIRSQNIYDHGFVEKGLVYINDEQAKKLDNVTVEKSDILFNITGASIARCCIVEDKYLPARVNQHVSIIRTNEKALPKYVQLILVSPEYKEKLLQIGEGATSRQAITKSQLEEFKIPLPPLAEQQKIVTEIEVTESQIAELERQIAAIPKQKEQVLKKYL